MLYNAAGLKRKRKRKGGMMLEAAGLKRKRKRKGGMMLMNAAGLPSHKRKGGGLPTMKDFLAKSQQRGLEGRIGRAMLQANKVNSQDNSLWNRPARTRPAIMTAESVLRGVRRSRERRNVK